MAPPAKRQRTEDAPVTRSIWHEDGSVVLQADNTQFRVHWSVLAMHSSFFRDMQKLPQPPDQPSVDGCPVVELPDAVVDVEELLKALYNPALFNEITLPFQTIASLVRLGRKYDFKDLLRMAVQRLHTECPSSLAKYDAMFAEGSELQDAIENYPGLYFEIINLARENSIFSILPCAYYCAIVLYPITSIFDGLPREDGTRVTLSPTDHRACIIGREKLMLTQWEPDKTLGWCAGNSDINGCHDPSMCGTKKSTVFRSLVLKSANSALSHSSNLKKLSAAMRMCPPCTEQVNQTMVEGRKKTWEALPSFFDLPPWSELKDDL
ncbi:hypothetical protein DFH09DRAFT_1140349 [Mycena vulgaris]|nr:hypothetical protein DFH09DRAFT_1140349 [Mycena vulgaris]